MMADDQMLHSSPVDDDVMTLDRVAVDEDLLPFDLSLISDGEASISETRDLAHKLQSQTRRYLLQFRPSTTMDYEHNDHYCALLTELATSIQTLGGQVEHYWSTPREYDLILVIRLKSHQISIGAIEMALTSMSALTALRVTPLHFLDEPDQSVFPNVSERGRA